MPSRSCTEHVSTADAGLRGSIQGATRGRSEKEANQPVRSGYMQNTREWKRRMERGRAKEMLNARGTRGMWLGAKEHLALSSCSSLEIASSPDFLDFEWSSRTLEALEYSQNFASTLSLHMFMNPENLKSIYLFGRTPPKSGRLGSDVIRCRCRKLRNRNLGIAKSRNHV